MKMLIGSSSNSLPPGDRRSKPFFRQIAPIGVKLIEVGNLQSQNLFYRLATFAHPYGQVNSWISRTTASWRQFLAHIPDHQFLKPGGVTLDLALEMTPKVLGKADNFGSEESLPV